MKNITGDQDNTVNATGDAAHIPPGHACTRLDFVSLDVRLVVHHDRPCTATDIISIYYYYYDGV